MFSCSLNFFFLSNGSGVVGILARAGWCMCACVRACVRVCVCVLWAGELGGMEVWVGSNITIFVFVYWCFSNGTCTLYFCVCNIYIVIYVLFSWTCYLRFFLSLTKCWRIMQNAVSLCTAKNSATQKLSIIIIVVIRNKTSRVALLWTDSSLMFSLNTDTACHVKHGA